MRLAEGKTLGDLSSDEVFALALERVIEVIGEAANNVSEAFKAAHPEIPWRSIRGQRNVIVHMYREIDYREIWKTASVDLPEIVQVLEPLIPPPPAGSS